MRPKKRRRSIHPSSSRSSWPDSKGNSSLPNASRNGSNAPPDSVQRPTSTCSERATAPAASSARKRALPMPGSPSATTRGDSPLRLPRSIVALAVRSSCVRPTRGRARREATQVEARPLIAMPVPVERVAAAVPCCTESAGRCRRKPLVNGSNANESSLPSSMRTGGEHTMMGVVALRRNATASSANCCSVAPCQPPRSPACRAIDACTGASASTAAAASPAREKATRAVVAGSDTVVITRPPAASSAPSADSARGVAPLSTSISTRVIVPVGTSISAALRKRMANSDALQGRPSGSQVRPRRSTRSSRSSPLSVSSVATRRPVGAPCR